LRQVERFFLETEGKLPHDWLSERRQKKALNLIRAGCIVKEVAGQLGYSQAANFSRDFKRFHGASPTEI
jgi:AraC-like DNA-binding protein